MVHWWSEIPTVNASRCPWPTGVAVFVYDALHPSGARGYRFQSYGPFNCSYTDIVWLMRDALIMLRVFCTWGVILSHSCNGKSLLVVASAAMNASLKVPSRPHSIGDYPVWRAGVGTVVPLRMFWCALWLGCPWCLSLACTPLRWGYRIAFCMPCKCFYHPGPQQGSSVLCLFCNDTWWKIVRSHRVTWTGTIPLTA